MSCLSWSCLYLCNYIIAKIIKFVNRCLAGIYTERHVGYANDMIWWSAQRATSFSRLRSHGFTIVELLIVIVVLAILASIVAVTYNGAQLRAADAVVQDTIKGAHDALEIYGATNRVFPSNIANTEYAPPVTVAVTLFTDATQTPVYSNLTSAQNAQLFLNTCNGFMPVTDGGTTYNTVCAYNGNNLHVKGTTSSNVVVHGPTFVAGDVALTCGGACDTAASHIISTFQAQGGSFPVTVISSGASLPAPTLISAGTASHYCLEGRSATFTDIVYHITSEMTAYAAGSCPANPSLHYP